jgi:hypothetical protein
MPQPHHRPVPLPFVEDGALALLARLRLPLKLRRRVLRELDLRRGSDRSGPRLPLDAADYLAHLESATLDQVRAIVTIVERAESLKAAA